MKLPRLLAFLALGLAGVAQAQTYGSAIANLTSPSLMSFNGIALSTKLPDARQYTGYTAYTSDQGMMYSNGTVWIAFNTGFATVANGTILGNNSGSAAAASGLSGITADATGDLLASGFFATKTVSLPGTYTRCTASQNVLCGTTTLTGSTVSGNYSAVDYLFTANGFANNSASALVNALGVEMDAGGTSEVGGFSGFYAKVKQSALTGNFAAGKNSNWAGATFEVRANANEGGSAGSGNGWGTVFGFNPTVYLNPGATFWRGLTGGEIDLTAASGSSVENIIGFHIVQTDSSVVAGSRENIGFDLDNGSTAAGWDLGFSLGNYDGYFPLTSGGTVMGCYRHAGSGTSCGTTTNGIDFDNGSSSKIIFTGKAFRSTGFSVDPTGITDVKSLTVNGKLAISPTAPTISSGFGSGATVSQNHGTSSFSINVGTGGVASTGVIGMPAADHAWACSAADVTTPAGNMTQETATGTSSVTITNYVRTTGIAGAWPASDVVQLNCSPN